MNKLERVKADLADLDKQNPDRRGPSGICANDLAKLIAVVEAASDAVGSVDDKQYRKELYAALSELDKP